MKTLIALILCTVLAASLFACGGKGDTTTGDNTTTGVENTGDGPVVTTTTLAPGETDVDNDVSWPSEWN